MTDRETAEIRRRYKTDKNNITHVAGCLVTQTHEIASEFDVPVASMTEDETDAVFGALNACFQTSAETLSMSPFPLRKCRTAMFTKCLTHSVQAGARTKRRAARFLKR